MSGNINCYNNYPINNNININLENNMKYNYLKSVFHKNCPKLHSCASIAQEKR